MPELTTARMTLTWSPGPEGAGDEPAGRGCVADRGTGRQLGWVRIVSAEPAAYRLELGIDRAWRGRGLGRELARGLTGRLAESGGSVRWYAGCATDDEPALRVARAAGLLESPEPRGSGQVRLELPRVETHVELSDATRGELLELWVAVNDAGGAVGFLPGVPRGQVAAALAEHEQSMAQGRSLLGVLRGPDRRLLGFGWWERNGFALFDHVLWLKRFQIHAGLRRRNLGRLLLGGMVAVARDMDGIALLRLEYRSGSGIGDFYSACGWSEVGRVPGMIRVGWEGGRPDDRDQVHMVRRVDGGPLVVDGRP